MAPVGSGMIGCAEGVVGMDLVIGTDMGADEKGFELVEKAVPFTFEPNAWLNGFVAPRWSAGLDRGAEGTKGNCGPVIDTDIGLFALVWPRDKFMNGFGALPKVVSCC